MARKKQPPSSQTTGAGAFAIDDGLGFLGNHPLNLDDKLRLTVPARFKAILQEKFHAGPGPAKVIVTLSLDEYRNAAVYPVPEWTRFLEQFRRMPALDRNRQTLQRLVTSLAIPCELDGQGRIRLDKKIVELAKLEKRVVVVGCEDHFEIWDERRFDDFVDKSIGHIDSLADSAMENLKATTAGTS